MNQPFINARRILEYLCAESENPAKCGATAIRMALELDQQSFVRTIYALTVQELVRQQDGVFTLTVAGQEWLRPVESKPLVSLKSIETGEPIIRTENLHRIYHLAGEDIHAINDVTLSIITGQMTAVVGHSGAGKTTLLNLLAGLDEPTEGSIWFKGQCLSDLAAQARLCVRRDQIGFVFQTFGLFPLLSATENVGVPLRMRRLPPAERETRVQEALAWVGLADRANHRPYELSGGEQQRVAVARALAARPSLILADEPTGQLDSQTGRQIVEILQGLVIEKGITVVIATHDPEVVERVDIVHELLYGRLVDTRFIKK